MNVTYILKLKSFNNITFLALADFETTKLEISDLLCFDALTWRSMEGSVLAVRLNGIVQLTMYTTL